MPDTLQELERERQGISRQIGELGDFRAGSITPTTGQNPDKPNSEWSSPRTARGFPAMIYHYIVPLPACRQAGTPARRAGLTEHAPVIGWRKAMWQKTI